MPQKGIYGGFEDDGGGGWNPSNPVKLIIWASIISIIIGISVDQFIISPQFQFRPPTSKPINNPNTNLPPAITNVIIDYPSANSARIKWTTKQKTTSRVIYCRLGTSCGDSGKDTRLTNDHEVIINDLVPDTQYEITINSADAYENQIELKLDNWVVTPPEKDLKKPTIISPIENIGSQTISWATDEKTTGKVILWSELLDKKTYNSIVRDMNHAVQIDAASILPKKAYYYMIIATDTSGNSTISEVRTYKTK